MVIYSVLGIFALFFAFLDSKKIFNKGLLFTFIIIFIFLAIRVDFGNDYLMYELYYNSLDKPYVSFYDLIGYDDHFEIGWRYLNRLFSLIGFNFNGFLAVIALFNCIVFYKFIKRFVPQNYYWLAIFIYIFNPDFLLIHLSAIRQLLPILLILSALPLLFSDKYLKFALIICLSSLFHTSSLIAILLIPLNFLNLKYSRRNTIILVLIYLALFVLSSAISDFMNSVVTLFFDRYEVYASEKANVSTGLGFFITFIFILFLFISKKNMNSSETHLINISVFSLLLSVIAINLSMVYRLNMYFIPFSILTFPLMVSHTKEFFQKIFLILVMMVYYLYTFATMFNSETFGPFYENYKTIFD